MDELGKRALNKAQTKLNILQAMHELLSDTNFRDLKAKDIAARANITEMTFFNYFKVKDDLLIYFMQIWTLDVMAMQLQEPLAGEAAIWRIFEFTGKQIEENPRLMLNLISYQASRSDCPMLAPLKSAEAYLRFPNLKALHKQINPDVGAIFLQHLNEINPNVDHQVTMMHLFSCFYGDALIAHLNQYSVLSLYRNTLEQIFKELR